MQEKITVLIPRQFSKPLQAKDGVDLRIFNYIEVNDFRLVTKFLPALQFKKFGLEEVITTSEVNNEFVITFDTDDRGYKNITAVMPA